MEVFNSNPLIKVAFKATLSPGQETFILLDDVSVRIGACHCSGSCDFESGLCTWVNSETDDHDWFNADGNAGGPLIDHTTHTTDGEKNQIHLNKKHFGFCGAGALACVHTYT